MGVLPAGIVTFLFTDVEGSTRLHRQLGDAFRELISQHDDLLGQCLAREGGVIVSSTGDGLMVAFSDAAGALTAAAQAQREVARHPWPAGVSLRVRMGLHTGPAHPNGQGYTALAVHQAARVADSGHGGQIVASGATAEAAGDLVGGLRLRSLGPHLLKDFDDPVFLFQVAGPGLDDDFPALRTPPAPGHDLPPDRSSLVGRDNELADLARRLTPGAVVTLTGPGGVGKTRVALRVARDAAAAWPDGVRLVDLAAVVAGADLVPMVATALGVRESPGRGLHASLIDASSRRQLLLVLDNAEHVSDACVTLVDSLPPSIGILVTSRRPLGAHNEDVVRLDPLALPAEHDSPDHLARNPAVALLVERAGQAGVELLPERDGRALAGLVRALGGLPLGIELAAARTAVFALDEIAHQLLTEHGGPSELRGQAGGRQVTLAATVAWSYRLCRDDDQLLLCRLSVFAAGATTATVEAVCADDRLSRAAIVEGLTGLQHKSLLTAESRNGARRFRMLESVRAFAADQQPADDAAATRRRHREWAIGWVRLGRDESFGEWLHRLDAEAADLHEAVRLALHDAPQDAATLATALAPYARCRGQVAVADSQLSQLLAHDLPVDVRLSVHLELLSGRLITDRSEAVFARLPELAAEAYAIGLTDVGVRADAAYIHATLGQAADGPVTRLRQLEARPGLPASARAELNQALGCYSYHWEGDPDAARQRLETARALYTAEGATLGELRTLAELGYQAYWGDRYQEALDLTTQALELARELGDVLEVAALQSQTAEVLEELGDRDGARALLEQALVAQRRAGAHVGRTLDYLASNHARSGRWAEAAEASEASLREYVGSPVNRALAMCNRANLALAMGALPLAAELLDEVRTLSLQHGAPPVLETAAAWSRGLLARTSGNVAEAAAELLAAAEGNARTGNRSMCLTVLHHLGALGLESGDVGRGLLLMAATEQAQLDPQTGPPEERHLLERDRALRDGVAVAARNEATRAAAALTLEEALATARRVAAGLGAADPSRLP
ncbi:MAG: AAA family ATPase [Actinomycetota bacterium]|nr:AAA family ATPase [Actinomycetota bacterium]